MNPSSPFRAVPTLRGSGRVGEEVAPVWSGVRPASLAFQWRRDGAPIPGAVAPVYIPGPEDDGAALDCLLLLGGTPGAAWVATAALRVTCPQPRTTGVLPEEVFDAGSGMQRIETAWAFAGLNLVFSATGGGAEIDPWTGVLTIPTDQPREGETVTVVATNSGGVARAALRFTVEAEAWPIRAAEEAPDAPGADLLRSVTPPSFARESGSAGAEPGAVWRVGGATWSGGVAPYTSENRIFRNGAMIRDWQAGSTYTIVEADRGATLTASVRLRDGSTPTAQEVIVVATGSAVVPAGGSVGSVVTTSAQLRTALQNAVAGETILVAPGNYDPFAADYLKGTETTGFVTVKSSVPGTPARFPNGLTSTPRRSLRGIIFDNFILGPSTQPARQNHTVIGVAQGNFRRLTFRNLLVENTLVGMQIINGNRDIVIEACEIVRTQRDAIRVYAGSNANSGCSGITLRNTKIHGHAIGTDGNHPDCIQFSTNSASAHSNVLIENNHFIEQKAASAPIGYVQGIFMRSEWLTGSNGAPGAPTVGASPNDYPALAWTNFIIRGNLIELDHANGIFLSGHKDLQCYGNLLKAKTSGQFTGNNGSTAGISLHFRNDQNCRAYNNVQARASIFTSADPTYLGRVSDFVQWGVTHLSSFVDTTVPMGWVNPKVGRYALD